MGPAYFVLTVMPDDLPIVHFESQQHFEAWLAEHHQTSPGAWLKIAKKGASNASVSYQEALDVALCYGWIDGQKRALDESHWLQRFTPRGRQSVWSRINRDKASELIQQGRMQPAGLAQVERAKADGRWDAAYAGQRDAEVPPDLESALQQDPDALAFFATLNSVNRYAILYRIQTAKKPETRQKRIAQFVEMLHERRTIYP